MIRDGVADQRLKLATAWSNIVAPCSGNINLKRSHCLPVRGSSQLIILLCGSLVGGSRSMAFLAKVFACSAVCRLSLGRDIHSRMIFRRCSCSGFNFKSLL